MTTPSDDKAISYVPQIQAAHNKAVAAQQSGHEASLKAAIEAGELLRDAKDAVGPGNWGKWRERHLRDISQPTVSLYIRLAENKSRFSERAISNAVTTLRDKGELSIRKAAALIRKTGTRRQKPKSATKTDLDVVKQCIKEVLAADELATIALEVNGADYLKAIVMAATKALTPTPPAAPSPRPAAVVGAGMSERRPLS
jgi:hypothetical protein